MVQTSLLAGTGVVGSTLSVGLDVQPEIGLSSSYFAVLWSPLCVAVFCMNSPMHF
jgi:hypothetical protein